MLKNSVRRLEPSILINSDMATYVIYSIVTTLIMVDCYWYCHFSNFYFFKFFYNYFQFVNELFFFQITFHSAKKL